MKIKVMSQGRNIILTILLPFISFSIHAQTGFPIHSSSGAVSYGSDTVKTTGTVKATTVVAPNATFGGISVNGATNTISVPGGTVGFGNSNLTTTGNLSVGGFSSSSIQTDSLKVTRLLPLLTDSVISFGYSGFRFTARKVLGPPRCIPNYVISTSGIFSFVDTNYSNQVLVGIGTRTPNAVLNINAPGTACTASVPYAFTITNPISNKNTVWMDKSGNSYFDGKVSIDVADTEMPGNYRLYVKGGILTEHCRVGVYGTTDWSDYVFSNNYHLPSLDSVETYISKNHHLEGIPSAQEVSKGGIDVANMDAQLLKKVEELTLYVIQLQKENAVLKQQVDAINNK